jgi:PadR family transcriptional regulator PadR
MSPKWPCVNGHQNVYHLWESKCITLPIEARIEAAGYARRASSRIDAHFSIDSYLALCYSWDMQSSFVANWQTQARKGVLELVILNGLKDEWMYGYEIAKTLQAIPALAVAEGTIYPIMSRLEKEGLVTSSLEASPEGPARKYYRLSDEGAAVLSRINVLWDEIDAGVRDLRGGPGR